MGVCLWPWEGTFCPCDMHEGIACICRLVLFVFHRGKAIIGNLCFKPHSRLYSEEAMLSRATGRHVWYLQDWEREEHLYLLQLFQPGPNMFSREDMGSARWGWVGVPHLWGSN